MAIETDRAIGIGVAETVTTIENGTTTAHATTAGTEIGTTSDTVLAPEIEETVGVLGLPVAKGVTTGAITRETEVTAGGTKIGLTPRGSAVIGA
jgi:hypothetical protein